MRKMTAGFALVVASFFAWAGAGNKVVYAEQGVVPEEGSIQIDETNFPDAEFRGYISETIDKNHNGVLDKREINETSEIFVFTGDIKSLKGVEYFVNLERLDCFGVDITNLTDKMGALTELDVSKNTNLTSLLCYGNQLKSLDVSHNLKLEWLECYFNQLTSMDVSKNTALKHLDCSKNKITKLDLSNQGKLLNLICSENSIRNLDLEDCPNLSFLECGENELVSLDVSDKTALFHLFCPYNHLRQLDVSNNLKLNHLDCYANEITKLDVSNLTELQTIECGANRLTELDVRNCSELNGLRCNENEISELDLSHNENLSWLECAANGISVLDLHAPGLRELNCSDNKLESLNIQGLELLTELYCSGCGLSELDVSGFPKLNTLDCSSNDLTKLDLSANKELFYLYTHYNHLGKLNISECKYLINQLQSPECRRILLKDDSGEDKREIYAYAEEDGPVFLTIDTDTEIVTSISIGDFVERLYTVALGRAPETQGKKYWISEITEGRKTGGDCGLFFLLGEEFTNRKLSDEDFVETLYSTFFDRQSEPAGKAYWVGALKNGSANREMVVRSFIDSREWCNLCATYGVRSGAPTAKADIASKNAINFATRLYTCCLGRSPEEGGLKYWSLALTNLEQTGCSAAKEFFQSEEFTQLNLPDKEYIGRLYTTFMDREAETSEIEYWAREIEKSTQTRDSVLAFFGQSPEFTDICAKYGIERGTI